MKNQNKKTSGQRGSGPAERGNGILRKIFEIGIVITMSVGLLIGFAEAGSLTPSASPAATMQTLQTIYDSIAGTFDSSGVSASSTGSLIANVKYISNNLFWASSSGSIYYTGGGTVGIGTSKPSSTLSVVSANAGSSTFQLVGFLNQTANLLTISSSTGQQFFTVSPMGVASSSEFRSPSSTIGTLAVTTCTGCGGFSAGVDTQVLYGILGGNASSSLTFTFSSSTGVLTVGSSSLTNVSSTNLDIATRFNFAAASSSGNLTVGGSFQSNASQNTFGNVSSTNQDVATRFNFAAASSSGNVTLGGANTQILNQLTFANSSSTNLDVATRFNFAAASSSGNLTVGGSFQSNASQNTLGNVSSTNLDIATRLNFSAASGTGNVTLTGANTQITNQLTFANASSTNLDVATRFNFAAASSTGNLTIGGIFQSNAGQTTLASVSSTNVYAGGYLFVKGNTNQTQNLLTLSSSTNQLFFTISPMGVVSSTEFRSPSSTIGTLAVTTCTGCGTSFTGVDTQVLFGILGGSASSSNTFLFSSSTGVLTVGSSSLTNVSSTNLDIATRFNFAAASSSGNLTVGGSFQSNASQNTFGNVSSTNQDVATRFTAANVSSTNLSISGYGLFPTLYGTTAIGFGSAVTTSTSLVFAQGTQVASTTLNIRGFANQDAPLLFVSTSTGAPLVTITGNGQLLIATSTAQTSSTLFTIATTTNIFTVLDNGNVGIFTSSTAPVDRLSIQGAPIAAATRAMLNLGNLALSGGSANGTFIGANPASFSGDFMNFQVANTNRLKVNYNGGQVAFTNASQGNTFLFFGGGGSSSGYLEKLDMNSNFTLGTGGIAQILLVGGTSNGIFAPTSGSGVLNNIEIQTGITQTATASGIVRGIYVNPTLTSAANYRSIEVASTTMTLASSSANNQVWNLINPPILSEASSSKYITASTFTIAGNPNPTSTIKIGMSLASSTALAIQGIQVSSTTNAYSLYIDAPWGASSTNAALVVSSGTVGIGTVFPTSTLHVQGQTNQNNQIFSVSSSTGQIFFTVGPMGVASSSEIYLSSSTLTNVLNCNGATNALGTDVNGKIQCDAGVSDARLKKDITSLSDGLSLLDSLNPVSYYWKDPAHVYGRDTAMQFGLIAQDLLQTAPFLVVTSTPTVLTPDMTYGVNYTSLFAPIIKAIQQLDLRTKSNAAFTAGSLAESAGDFAGTLQSALHKLGVSIADGVLTIREIIADKLTAKKLCLDDVCITKNELKSILDKANTPAAPGATSNVIAAPPAQSPEPPQPAPQDVQPTSTEPTAPTPPASQPTNASGASTSTSPVPDTSTSGTGNQ